MKHSKSSRKNWVMVSATILGAAGFSVLTQTEKASAWQARSASEIQVGQGVTSYTFLEGDTLWEVENAAGIEHGKLAALNQVNLDSGEQYYMPIGTVITLDGSTVTATYPDGTSKSVNLANGSSYTGTGGSGSGSTGAKSGSSAGTANGDASEKNPTENLLTRADLVNLKDFDELIDKDYAEYFEENDNDVEYQIINVEITFNDYLEQRDEVGVLLEGTNQDVLKVKINSSDPKVVDLAVREYNVLANAYNTKYEQVYNLMMGLKVVSDVEIKDINDISEFKEYNDDEYIQDKWEEYKEFYTLTQKEWTILKKMKTDFEELEESGVAKVVAGVKLNEKIKDFNESIKTLSELQSSMTKEMMIS